MSVTFGGKLASRLSLTLTQQVDAMQLRADPPVEWEWRFTAVPRGVGVHLMIPAKADNPDAGWELGKEFIAKIPTDPEAAGSKLAKWFAEVHAQFRQANQPEQVIGSDRAPALAQLSPKP